MNLTTAIVTPATIQQEVFSTTNGLLKVAAATKITILCRYWRRGWWSLSMYIVQIFDGPRLLQIHTPQQVYSLQIIIPSDAIQLIPQWSDYMWHFSSVCHYGHAVYRLLFFLKSRFTWFTDFCLWTSKTPTRRLCSLPTGFGAQKFDDWLYLTVVVLGILRRKPCSNRLWFP